MSLLMEALKRAEAAKFAVTVPPPQENLPITENVAALPTSELETFDEVSAWQQQLLSETSEQTHFIIEDSEEDHSDTENFTPSPLETLLNDDAAHEIDWEREILPEFQNSLDSESNLEPLVLEDNRSHLPVDEEPEIISETEMSSEASPMLTLNFSREIAPDLSLHELHQPPVSNLKLEWEEELTSTLSQPPEPPPASPTPPQIPPVQAELTSEPSSSRPLTLDESAVRAQREEIKRLFKASLQRKSTSRWMYGVAILVIVVVGLGGYGLYHEKLLEQYIHFLNQQVGQSALLIDRPAIVAQSPVEPAKPLEIKPQPTQPQPTLAQVASPEPSPAPKPPPVAPPVMPVVPPEPVKSAFIPRERPLEPKIEPKPIFETKQAVENKEIQITRSGKKSQDQSRLLQAYSALQRGDDKMALTLYHAVLKEESRSRDALLGLAAIAVRQRQFPLAVQYYQTVLTYYPQDPVAKTNLLSLSGQTTGGERESQLKTLVNGAQKPAYIHFQLGVIYAEQQRWREAQQAFFEAYRIEPQQADYAYNLAVSLEHLQQSQAAVGYYQRAIQLQQKQQKSYSFQTQTVQQRIATLQATTQGRGMTSVLNEDE